MKKIIIILATLAAIYSCKPHHAPTTIDDFEVNISRIESHKVWIDIFPQDEFLPYVIDWFEVDEFNAVFPDDQSYLDAITTSFIDLEPKYVQLCCSEGSYMSAIVLDPDTRYVLVLAQIEGATAVKMRKVEFQTLPEHLTSFNLYPWEISMNGDGLISINPEDTVNTYYWDYDLKKTVDEEWNGFHSALFYYDMDFYYQYDFFPEVLSKGYDEENFFDYFSHNEIAVGDTICLVAVGYDETGETSRKYIPFWITYYGERGGVVSMADLDGLEGLYRPNADDDLTHMMPSRRHPLGYKSGELEHLFEPNGYAEMLHSATSHRHMHLHK